MFTLLASLSILFYFTSAAPLLANHNDQKMIDGQSSYQPFNLFDLPVVSNKHPRADPMLGDQPVKAGLAVVASAEENAEPSPFTGYGEAIGEAPKLSSDAFVIGTPDMMQEEKEEKEGDPIGVVPKFTGHFLNTEQSKVPTDKSGAAITNPSAYFLQGADLDKVPKPKCRMIGCDGPIVEDDMYIEQDTEGEKGEKCYQAFVPLVDAQIRVGMSCRVCCESSALLKELKKSKLQLNSE